MTELRWGERTFVMGIINVTPDSFSGDGLAPAGSSSTDVVEAALGQARAFVAAGADILDVGAESTRPSQFYGDHPRPTPEAEAALAVPVVEALAMDPGTDVAISIDTSRGSVARSALAAGAVIVNDVWGGRDDPQTVQAAAEAGAYLVLMHNQARAEHQGSIFDEVVAWLSSAIEDAIAGGMALDRVIVDPGIGFGKTPGQSVELLHRLGELKAALGGLPVLVGTSRKRFIGELLGGAPPDQRLEGTAATVALAIAQGVDVVRVHDVAPIVRTVRVADGIARWRP
jgi:dihydropteroate synthase